MGDMIHKPDHYCFSKFEPKDVIREWGLNFNLGSAVKYIARAGRKDNIIQDLKKAKEFLTFEIEALEAERPKKTTPEPVNCRCSSYPHLMDIMRMSAKEFLDKWTGKPIPLPTVLLGALGDKWSVLEINREYSFQGTVTVTIRCQRMTAPHNKITIVLV